MTQILPIQPSQSADMVLPNSGWAAPPAHLPDEGISASAFVGLIRRNWITILITVGVSLAAAYIGTRLTTPVYRASTTLYFADRQGSMPALDILNQMESGNNEVATEMEVMRSRALAEVVVDSLGMQVRVVDPPDGVTSNYLRIVLADPLAPDSSFRFTRMADGTFAVKNAESGSVTGTAVVNQPFSFGHATSVVLPTATSIRTFDVRVRPRSATVASLVTNLTVTRPNPTASVVQISYTGHDRVETKNVPDVLARTYLAWWSSLRKSGDRSTVEFLRTQIDTISGQLFAAEESLRRFRESNQVLDLPTQAQTDVQRLAALEAQRTDINTQLASLKSLRAEVTRAPSDSRLGSPYRRLMAFPGLMTTANPALSLLQTLTDLEQRRADLLVRRTASDPDVQSLTQAIANIENQIAAVVDTYITGLEQQSNSLSASLSQFHAVVDRVPQREVDYARLDRNATGLTQIYTMLQTRLREAQIAEAVDDDAVRIVDPAAFPIRPIAPRPLVNLLLGGLIGLLLAFGIIVLRDRLDHTVHTKEEVEAISGAPVLALIPHIGEADRAKYFQRWRVSRGIGRKGSPESKKGGPANGQVLLKDGQSVASEAFRKLRTNITFARPDVPPRVLIFTSPAAGDGKSTSVMNLAIALVQQGKRVIVVDADMRRGGLHKLLRGFQTPGLSEILVGQSELQAAIQSLTLESFGTVDMLATGVIPPNPAELLASSRFRATIEALRSSYDAVLVDSPPINLVTDAAIMGRETDGAVVVARASKTTRGELAHAIGQLRQVQVPVTGVIFNDYNPKRDGAYNAPYYGYAYEYRPYTT